MAKRRQQPNGEDQQEKAHEPPPGEGHNAVGIDRDTFLAHVARLARADSKLEAARQERLKVRREAKAAGIELGQLDAASKILTLDDDDARRKLTALSQYLVWMRAPKVLQLNLPFDDRPDPMSDEDVASEVHIERARADGFRAGLTDQPENSSPHEASSPLGQAWLAAWHDGRQSAQSDLLNEGAAGSE